MAETNRKNEKRGRGRPRKYGELDRYVGYQNDPDRDTLQKYDIHTNKQAANVFLAERSFRYFEQVAAGSEKGATDYQLNVCNELMDAPDNGWKIVQRVMTELGRLVYEGRTEQALEALGWWYRYRSTPGTHIARVLRQWRLEQIETLPEKE